MTNLNRLLWRRYRARFWALAVITLIIGIVLTLLDTAGWGLGNQHQLFTGSIRDWRVYTDNKYANVSLYSMWLVCISWLVGLLTMLLDRTDNFNQFLFASGYRRQTVYWHKLGLSLAGLCLVIVTTTAVQYAIYWLNVPHYVAINVAWPAVLTSWALGLAMSVGMFAICWFAALIVGQTGPLMVTVIGFTISLIGVTNGIQGLLSNWDAAALDWLAVGLWLGAAVILFVWGAVLYPRLSLEQNGEYLLFPGLRWPVYIVFVVYMSSLFVFNGSDLQPAITSFIFTVIFGYWWLWRPNISALWHRN